MGQKIILVGGAAKVVVQSDGGATAVPANTDPLPARGGLLDPPYLAPFFLPFSIQNTFRMWSHQRQASQTGSSSQNNQKAWVRLPFLWLPP